MAARPDRCPGCLRAGGRAGSKTNEAAGEKQGGVGHAIVGGADRTSGMLDGNTLQKGPCTCQCHWHCFEAMLHLGGREPVHPPARESSCFNFIHSPGRESSCINCIHSPDRKSSCRWGSSSSSRGTLARWQLRGARGGCGGEHEARGLLAPAGSGGTAGQR